MSTKEAPETKTDEPVVAPINEETGLPDGLDPGESYMDKSPEEKSDPIPISHATRLVGKTEEEAAVILAEERVAAAEALVEEQKNAPTEPETADEELTAAKRELADAEKAAAAAEKAEDTPSTTKTTAKTS